MLTVVLLDVRGFEVLWVLDVVEGAAYGWEAIEVFCKMCLVSCVDDVQCVHPRIGYFFKVADAVIVAIWLRPWSLDCRWLSTPGAMTARDFLLLLVSLVLLL